MWNSFSLVSVFHIDVQAEHVVWTWACCVVNTWEGESDRVLRIIHVIGSNIPTVYVLLRTERLKNISYFLLIWLRYQMPDYIASRDEKISELEIAKMLKACSNVRRYRLLYLVQAENLV